MYKKIAQLYGNITFMLVTIDEQNKQYNFVATAFVCSSNGYFITSAHTIKFNEKLGIMISRDINEFNFSKAENLNGFPVTVVGYDAINDVALLKCTVPITISLPNPSEFIGDERSMMAGANVAYLGYPYGKRELETVKVSATIVSSKILTPSGTRTLQIDSSVNDGNSGGPLVDFETGKVVGIITGRFSPSGSIAVASIGGVPLGQESNISYAVGISYAIDLMKDEGIYV